MTTKRQALLAATTTAALLLTTVGAAEATGGAPTPPVTSNVDRGGSNAPSTAVRTGSPAAHTSTPEPARTYAMTTAAMYDAVNGIDAANETSSRSGALLSSYSAAPAGADRETAASAAAHTILGALFRRYRGRQLGRPGPRLRGRRPRYRAQG